MLTARTSADLLNAALPTNSCERATGLAYGRHSRQRIDWYRPLMPLRPGPASGDAAIPASDAPLVVFFPDAGGWSDQLSDYRFVGAALASQGIVAAIADYRGGPLFDYSTFVQDAAMAVRWAVDHAGHYGASPSRAFVMGHGLGAYNAAMIALDARWLAPTGMRPAQLAGWIGLAGPYNFLPITDDAMQRAFGWPDTPADSQPLAHASSASPRTLLLAPGRDRVFDVRRNTQALADKLAHCGVWVQTSLFNSVNHLTLLGALAPLLHSRAPVLAHIARFVHARV